MATTPLVHVDEYLRSSFEPDAEYVAGRIVRRAMPQKPHSRMQGYLIRGLYDVAHPLGFEVWPEQRIRTKSNPPHFRVPDVCLTRGEPDEDIFTHAPFLCIEILSPEDSPLELRMKIEEYLSLGTAYVWVVDPIAFTGRIHTRNEVAQIDDGIFRAGEIEIDVTRAR